MAYWLVKSEPKEWSWDDHCNEKDRTASWDGVRNYQAANNMKAMKKGDKAFFYHSVKEKRIVGTLEVVKEYHPDPTDEKGRFGQVDFRALEAFKEPVTLAAVKADERFQSIALVRQSRLSVMPIPDDVWALFCEMGGIEP